MIHACPPLMLSTERTLPCVMVIVPTCTFTRYSRACMFMPAHSGALHVRPRWCLLSPAFVFTPDTWSRLSAIVQLVPNAPDVPRRVPKLCFFSFTHFP